MVCFLEVRTSCALSIFCMSCIVLSVLNVYRLRIGIDGIEMYARCDEVARAEQRVRKGKVLGKLHEAVTVTVCILYAHTYMYTVVTGSR